MGWDHRNLPLSLLGTKRTGVIDKEVAKACNVRVRMELMMCLIIAMVMLLLMMMSVVVGGDHGRGGDEDDDDYDDSAKR